MIDRAHAASREHTENLVDSPTTIKFFSQWLFGFGSGALAAIGLWILIRPARTVERAPHLTPCECNWDKVGRLDFRAETRGYRERHARPRRAN